MIANLFGYIRYAGKTRLIVDVNHISYWVNVHENHNFKTSDEKGVKINCLQIKQLGKNNIITEEIYGFDSIEKSNFFRDLLSCQGIGPKTALQIMQNDLNLIQSLIRDSDSNGLNQLPGINAKTAHTLVGHSWKPWMLGTSYKKQNDKHQRTKIEQNNFDAFSVNTIYQEPDFNQTFMEISDTLKSLGYKDNLIHDTLIEMDIAQNDDVAYCVSEAIKRIALKEENECHSS